MDFNFLFKGVILGFSIAAPVGPIGLLCIRRTLQFGRFSGLFSGLGAAAADTIYGVIAAFGLKSFSDFFLSQQFPLRVVGGAFLIYLGVKTFFSKMVQENKPIFHKTLGKDFVSTFFLTLTNPMTIISYLAIFAGLGLSNVGSNYLDASVLVTGVFVGSALWWLILSEGVTFFRKKVSQQVMLWINRFAGLIIVGFGIMAFLALF